MKISFRCAHCGKIFWNDDDTIFLEIDFKEEEIRFLCPSPNCGKENILSVKNWKEQSKKSPLPSIMLSR
jgi:predicted RNA-binding Zn-ribbon protein involved in translation (DUF1610 family)